VTKELKKRKRKRLTDPHVLFSDRNPKSERNYKSIKLLHTILS